jgi:hypothetical protein
MMQWHEENLRSGGGESTSFTPEVIDKEQLKASFSLKKIRSMVEGTPLKELKRSERKRSSCCTCCRNWRCSSLQCHCLKLELTVKR